MSYTPPTSPVTLNFTGSYTPPTSPVTVEFSPAASQTVTTTGWDALAFGASWSGHGWPIFPAGIAPGGAGVANVQRVAKAYGFDSSQFGILSTYNFNRHLRLSGIAGPTFGTAVVEYRTKYVLPVGVNSTLTFGSVRVSGYYQYVAAAGTASAAYGNAQVKLRTQRVYAGIQQEVTYHGTPFVAYRYRQLAPLGIDSLVVGTADVRDKAQRCRPVGLASTTKYGYPVVRYRTTTVSPFGLDSLETGYPVAQLYRRCVKPAGLKVADPEPSRFGTYTTLANRNRKLLVNGSNTSWVSRNAIVLNTGRALLPRGADAGGVGAPRVSHWTQLITPPGFDLFYSPQYSVVTTRKMASPYGFNALRTGTPRLWSNLQTVRAYSPDEQLRVNAPWVSFGTRVVAPTGIQEPPTGWAFIAPRVRFIYPTLIENWVGIPTLTIHRNIVNAWGYDHGGVGIPAARNVTTEIHAFSAVAFEAGKPKVALLCRYVDASGEDSAKLGTPYVAYRTRKLRPYGLPSERHGLPTVYNASVVVTPAPQRIFTLGLDVGAFDDKTRVSLNTVTLAGFGSMAFGTPKIANYYIVVDRPIDSMIALGAPKVLGGVDWLRPSGWSESGVGSPTIIGAQVIDVGRAWTAGPPPTWYKVNRHTTGYYGATVWEPMTVGPAFGATRVSTYHRQVRVSSTDNDQCAAQFGTPRLGRNPARVYPSGILSYRRGIPNVILVGDVAIRASGADSSTFGLPRVVSPWLGPQTVTPAGVASGSAGVPLVELFNRTLIVSGWDSSAVRRPLYVGPYLRCYPTGHDSAACGKPFVSYRVHTLQQLPITDGEPAWRSATVKHEARGYYVEGSDFSPTFGVAGVAPRIRHVVTSGWQEFETGFSWLPDDYPGGSSLKAQAFLAAPSNLFTEFGNVQIT